MEWVVNNMKRKVFILCLLFVMSVIFGGCSIPNLILNNKTESYKYSLTARQKQILKQEGLPLDYEKLDDMQKSAIECIEDIFKYLDKTYPKKKYVIRTANIYILLYYYYNFLTFIFIFYFII